ncbi:MAG: N-acetyltransferase protein [Anaerolineales bacterium]|jgi:RimJ/RimL family protein N-acetyltransferase|nr:N-acetyltransferase protein [Anaerolineales bacterium]
MSVVPSHATETVTLPDGTAVTLRPIRPDDVPRLQALHSRLSPETIYLRFLGMHPTLFDKEAEKLANVDYQTRMALVATRTEQEEESLIGVARYAVTGPERPGEAEVAIVIEDQYQGQGLGTLLVDRIMAYARAHGVRVFFMEVNAENDRILHFVRRSGLPTEKVFREGVWEIRVKIS